MVSFAKLDECVFNPDLSITVHRHTKGGQKSLHLLSIEKFEGEVYIVDQFSYFEKRGFFVIRPSFDEAVEIYTVLQTLLAKKEPLRLSEDRRKVENIICYDADRKPYFYFK